MACTFLQSVLCLCLSPLLVAQEVSQGAPQQVPLIDTTTIMMAYPVISHDKKIPPDLLRLTFLPEGTAIPLIPMDSMSPLKPIVGTVVRFRVARNVDAYGRTVLPAGMRLEGVVTKVRKGPRSDSATKTFRDATEVALGTSVKLRLYDAVGTRKRYTRNVARSVLRWTLRGIAIAGLLPLFVLWFLAWSPILLFDCKDGC